MTRPALKQLLKDALNGNELILDAKSRALLSHDIASGEAVAEIVVRPTSIASLSNAVALAAKTNFALIPRGSGHSYSGGTVPDRTQSMVIDTTALDQIIEISQKDRFVRVQAGCTWATLLTALEPLGYRTPFFGPLSGYASTIGGALSQRAAFFGSAMHGFSDNSVIGQTIVLADGSILRTGTGHDRQPHPQPSGPDLGPLFLGDCGAMGIKVEATLRLTDRPGAEVFASFAYPDMASLLQAQIDLCGIDGIAECFGFDHQANINLAKGGFEFLEGAEIVVDVLRQSGSTGQRLGRIAQLFRDGRRAVAQLQSSLHICLEGETETHACERLAKAGAIALRHGGEAIPDTIPRVTRSRPFRPIKALLGPEGERWLPLHGIFRLSDVTEAYSALADALAERREELASRQVTVSFLTVTSGDTIVIEPHLFWPDGLHRFHRHHVTDEQLRRYGDLPDRPELRDLAHALRRELGSVLYEAGAEHLQIGRHYPFEQDIDPVRLKLLLALKHHVDPKGLMAPDVLFKKMPNKGMLKGAQL